MRAAARFGWGMVLAAQAAAGAAAPKPVKPPKDAPFCAVPGTRQLFVAPMGEPFRAASGQPYPSAAWFAAADRNRDGAVDRAELAADAAAFFRRLDRDGDGRLTPEEVAGYEHDVAPEIGLYAARRDPDARRRRSAGLFSFGGSGESAGYGGPIGAGRYAWLNIPEPVAAADADVDRVVTAAEFAGAAGRRFDALDPRGAGALRPADMPRTPQQVAIEGPCRPRPQPRAGERPDAFDDPDPAADPVLPKENAPR